LKIQLFIIFIFLSIGCSSYKYANFENGPDLIIESASITVNLEDGKDQVGMPVQSTYKLLNITVKIKNIGTEPFNSSLYIASTNSEEDYKLNNFNSFKLVEPSPTRLSPNELVEFNFSKRVARNSSNIKFQVNFNSSQENIAKETDYFNNTYSVNY
jgi:hypothetical protein